MTFLGPTELQTLLHTHPMFQNEEIWKALCLIHYQKTHLPEPNEDLWTWCKFYYHLVELERFRGFAWWKRYDALVRECRYWSPSPYHCFGVVSL